MAMSLKSSRFLLMAWRECSGECDGVWKLVPRVRFLNFDFLTRLFIGMIL